MTSKNPPPAAPAKTADPAPTLGPPPGVPASSPPALPNIDRIMAESPGRNGVFPVPVEHRQRKPILWSVKFREALSLAGLSPIDFLSPHDNEKQKEFEIIAAGPLVYVALPKGRTDHLLDSSKKPSGAFADAACSAGYGIDPEEALREVRQVVEVPRQACVIRWLVDGNLSGEAIVKAIQGAPVAGPDAGVQRIRRERIAAAEARKVQAAQPRPVAESLTRPKADDDDDLADEVGMGEESEPESP